MREVSLLVSYINVNQQSTQKKQHIKFRVVGKQNNIYTWKGYNFFFFYERLKYKFRYYETRSRNYELNISL